MGKFYLAHTAYNGEAYHGWQKQVDLPTIQEAFYKTIDILFENGNKKAYAASRTDANVNALGQVVKMLIPRRMDCDELKKLLNDELPNDIYIHQLDRINPSFKVTDLVVKKEYLYFFSFDPKFNFITKIPKDTDIELMKQAAKIFVGTHNFTNFQYKSQTQGGFKREIFNSEIVNASELIDGLGDNTYCYKICGSGFLKQMVRIIVGALVFAGNKHTLLSDIEKSLTGVAQESKLGIIAPGDSLFLDQIYYPTMIDRPVIVDKQGWKKEIDFSNFFTRKNESILEIQKI